MTAATATARPPGWYWWVSGLAFLWMAVGIATWTLDLMADETTAAGLSEAQRQLYAVRPDWVFAAYGVAVASGLAGALGLLLRRGWAVAAMILSLAAAVLHFGYIFLVLDAIGLLGLGAVPFPLFILTAGVFLVWFSAGARRRGWIG
jgi:hypothetical protein